MTLSELLGIEFPIVQAPMANNAGPALAAAVSGAGALGSVAGATISADELRAEIREVREATDRPFVNLFAPPYLREENRFWRDPKLRARSSSRSGSWIPRRCARPGS